MKTTLEILKSQLPNAEGEKRIGILLSIIESSNYAPIATMTVYLEELFDLCQGLAYKESLAAVYLAQYEVYSRNGKTDLCLNVLKKRHEVLEQTDNHYLITDSYIKIGICHRNQIAYKEAKVCYEKALALAQLHKIEVLEYQTYNTLAVDYFREGDKVKANEYFIKALNGFNKIGNKKFAAAVYSNLVGHKLVSSKEKSIEYLQKAIEINLEIKNWEWLATNYAELAQIFYEQGDFDKFLTYINKCIEEAKKKPSNYHLAMAYYLLAHYCLKEGIKKEENPDLALIEKSDFWSLTLNNHLKNLPNSQFEILIKYAVQYFKARQHLIVKRDRIF